MKKYHTAQIILQAKYSNRRDTKHKIKPIYQHLNINKMAHYKATYTEVTSELELQIIFDQVHGFTKF